MEDVQALLEDVGKLATNISKQKSIKAVDFKRDIEKIAQDHGLSPRDVESRFTWKMGHPSSSRT